MTGYIIRKRHWPSPSMMAHRSVKIDTRYTHQRFRVLKECIRSALLPSPSRPLIRRKAIIYKMSHASARSISEKLAEYLDTTIDLHKIDIITLVGTMTKEEKGFYTNLFLSEKEVSRYNAQIMCATSGAGNAGLDSTAIGSIFRLEMPESMSDFFQEKGRAGRYPNAHPTENRYTICFSIEDLLYLFRRTMNPIELVINESYRKRKVIDLIQMALVLASDECMNRSEIKKKRCSICKLWSLQHL